MHSTFEMFWDLARFGTLMLVIVLGFALAFYAMFGSTSAPLPNGGEIAAYDTYYSSLLTLFGSMLGSFDFSVFDDAPMGEAGVVLLAFFLCVMNITLLNLLIAILATAHARVEGNADKEAVLSEALIITQYRRAMRLDALPSPLNVPQELISTIFWRHRERSKELFARGVFWLISGPIAIAATAILWAVSLPLTLAWAGRVLRSNGTSMLLPSVLGISFNLGVAPMVATWLWLRGVVGIWRQGHGAVEISDRTEIEASRAHRRGSNANAPGSPMSKFASAAVAAKASGAAAATRGGATAGSNGGSGGGGGGGGGGNHGSSSKKSTLWQRAAEVNISHGDGAGRHRGFDVVEAVYALHGLTIQQLRERLDNKSPGGGADEAMLKQQGEAFAESLAGIRKGHERLEELIEKAEKNSARVESKLDELISALRDRDQNASSATRPSAEEGKPPPNAGAGAGSEKERRGDEKGRSTAADHARHSSRQEEPAARPSLDDFIDQFHAEVSGK